jgi:hypothetical protein
MSPRLAILRPKTVFLRNFGLIRFRKDPKTKTISVYQPPLALETWESLVPYVPYWSKKRFCRSYSPQEIRGKSFSLQGRLPPGTQLLAFSECGKAPSNKQQHTDHLWGVL